MSKNIVDELLKSLNVSISKTRLDKNLVTRNLICKNNSLLLDKVSLNTRDLKKLINLCMIEGDMAKMQIIGDYIVKNNREIIPTLNVYEAVSTNNMECLCIYAKNNIRDDEFLLKILIEAMIETQTNEVIIRFIKKSNFNTRSLDDLILKTENESLILAYVCEFEVDILKFQNRLIKLAMENKNPEFLIKFYLAKKPKFFSNIEDTLLKLQFSPSNIDLLIEYLEVNPNAKKKLFDIKFNNTSDLGIKHYYSLVMFNYSIIEIDEDEFSERFKECKHINKCIKNKTKELRKI